MPWAPGRIIAPGRRLAADPRGPAGSRALAALPARGVVLSSDVMVRAALLHCAAARAGRKGKSVTSSGYPLTPGFLLRLSLEGPGEHAA
ncbi:hypothetical protein GCM10009670_00350 [Citricoccus alkalitolerans]